MHTKVLFSNAIVSLLGGFQTLGHSKRVWFGPFKHNSFRTLSSYSLPRFGAPHCVESECDYRHRTLLPGQDAVVFVQRRVTRKMSVPSTYISWTGHKMPQARSTEISCIGSNFPIKRVHFATFLPHRWTSQNILNRQLVLTEMFQKFQEHSRERVQADGYHTSWFMKKKKRFVSSAGGVDCSIKRCWMTGCPIVGPDVLLSMAPFFSPTLALHSRDGRCRKTNVQLEKHSSKANVSASWIASRTKRYSTLIWCFQTRRLHG
jgi:hypothetical protein